MRIDFSDDVCLEKIEGEWRLYLALDIARGEGLADEFTDPDEVIKLAKSLECAAVELRKRRESDPVKCNGCGSQVNISGHWLGFPWCKSCIRKLADLFESKNKEVFGGRLTTEQMKMIAREFRSDS